METGYYGEITASIGDKEGYIRNINGKYIDDYVNGKSKIGDATSQTSGWHGSRYSGIISNNYIYTRIDEPSQFSIFNCGYGALSYTDDYNARAIMICGEGI